MFAELTIGFIGGGNMGEALIKGFLGTSLVQPHQIKVYDVLPERLDHLRQRYAVQASSDLGALSHSSSLLILAVKPQTMATVLKDIRAHLAHHPLVVSIAAGISLGSLTAALPEGLPVIRVMPNTPALVQEGASALARGSHTSDQHMELAMALFRAVGKAVEVEEKWMDAVTGLSGSGPAYVLLLLESLIDAGVLVGLPRPIARELVVQTALGTARMLQETGKHPGELKDMITSPGGTTITGLQILEEHGVRGALITAVEAATARSKALGLK
jgi:pyrroline-5-carboxylate reductase